MARPRTIARLKRLWAAYRKRQQAGFTLLELLVAMFIGSLITISLLTLVVQLVDVNQRDASRSGVQRDMQAALNYVSQELREAVFVYDGVCLQGSVAALTTANFGTECPGVINYIPASLSATTAASTSIPVLAFWRADPLPSGLLATCATNANSLSLTVLPIAVRGVPCLSGRSYTLVVYALVDDTSTTDQWQGRGRLVRYQLAQFGSSATTAANATPGYVDPLSAPNSSFQQWPWQLTTVNNNSVVVNAQTAAGGRPPDSNAGSFSAVLVDYVDDGLLPVVPACGTNGVFTPTNSPNRSFYACVRGKTKGAVDAEQGVNQEVQVFLVGDVQGQPGYPIKPLTRQQDITDQTFPSTTRVLTRGIVNKSPK